MTAVGDAPMSSVLPKPIAAAARQGLGHRLAFDEFHDEIAQIALATEQALVIDDCVVVHAAKLACFFDQKLQDLRIVRQSRRNDLYRVYRAELDMLRSVHRTR